MINFKSYKKKWKPLEYYTNITMKSIATKANGTFVHAAQVLELIK
jgi:hypothetical protein